MKTTLNFRRFCPISGKRFFTISIILLMVATTSTAQKKWSFEIRPGANFATTELGDANLNTGFGFEGTVAYRLLPHLAAYTGWSWNRFSADQSFAGSNIDFVETGYCFGLQFLYPIGQSGISYMVKGGGTYNHIETENSDGKMINDTGHGLGWQAGAGITIPLSKRLLLIPEVRYRSLSREIKIDNITTAADLNYVSVGAGLSWSF